MVTEPSVLIIEHEQDAGAGYLGECLERDGLTMEVLRPYEGQPVPGTLERYGGLIVLGGTPGPGDDHVAGWLPEVRRLMAHALEARLPTLGVCLGGQLLAVVAGGRVQRAAGGPELGLCDLHRLPAADGDPLFGNLPAVIPAVEWHFEEIVTLPPGSGSLLRSDQFAHQAFRVGPAAWGMQFHMEVLVETTATWADQSRADLEQAGLTVEQVVGEVAAAEPRLRQVWGDVAARWARLVRAS